MYANDHKRKVQGVWRASNRGAGPIWGSEKGSLKKSDFLRLER